MSKKVGDGDCDSLLFNVYDKNRGSKSRGAFFCLY